MAGERGGSHHVFPYSLYAKQKSTDEVELELLIPFSATITMTLPEYLILQALQCRKIRIFSITFVIIYSCISYVVYFICFLVFLLQTVSLFAFSYLSVQWIFFFPLLNVDTFFIKHKYGVRFLQGANWMKKHFLYLFLTFDATPDNGT